MKSIFLAGSLLFGGWFGVNASDIEFKPRSVETPIVEVNELHAYVNELLEGYDVTDLTEEEIAALQAEINALVQAKADELGLTLKEDHDVFSQFVDRELMGEVVAYAKELIATYDFENMTEEEIAIAKAEIQTLIEAKAAELGVTLPKNGLGFARTDRGRGFGRGKGFMQGGRGSRGGMGRGEDRVPEVTEPATSTSTNSL